MTQPVSFERIRGDLKAGFLALSDPKKAEKMKAYMKSSMPFFGVPATPMRATCKRIFALVDIPSAELFQQLVLFLWRSATHREERYAAIELTKDRRARSFHTVALLPMYEEMIRTGAWWDFIDAMVHPLGLILAREPEQTQKQMLAWSQDTDIWIRRSAILCQLDAKDRTDATFLYQCIEPSLGSKEFFLQKAIGWILRQYAKTNSEEVSRYVEQNQHRLSRLSYREAMKHIKRLP